MQRLWCVLLAVLAGCSTLAPVPQAAPLLQDFIPSFEISGRLSVRHADEGFSGNLRWRHILGADEFVLQTPLGQGIARVTQNSQGATLQTADGQLRYAPDAESLTQQVLGFRLPLAGLPHWVQAHPLGAAGLLRHNADGTLGFLSEQGWQIEYLAYQTVGAVLLPSKLSMENDALKLRLVIDDWVIDDWQVLAP